MFISDRSLLVVGIDHGFSMMKTPHATFENGVEKLGGEATLSVKRHALIGTSDRLISPVLMIEKTLYCRNNRLIAV